MANVVGAIPGISVGEQFDSRVTLSKSGVHRPNRAGIGGTASEGAVLIVISGGYEDDEDLGHTIIYTGAGERDPNTGTLIADQTLEGSNKALAFSKDHGIPVRVSRGGKHKSIHSPLRQGIDTMACIKLQTTGMSEELTGFWCGVTV